MNKSYYIMFSIALLSFFNDALAGKRNKRRSRVADTTSVNDVPHTGTPQKPKKSNEHKGNKINSSVQQVAKNSGIDMTSFDLNKTWDQRPEFSPLRPKVNQLIPSDVTDLTQTVFLDAQDVNEEASDILEPFDSQKLKEDAAALLATLVDSAKEREENTVAHSTPEYITTVTDVELPYDWLSAMEAQPSNMPQRSSPIADERMRVDDYEDLNEMANTSEDTPLVCVYNVTTKSQEPDADAMALLAETRTRWQPAFDAAKPRLESPALSSPKRSLGSLLLKVTGIAAVSALLYRFLQRKYSSLVIRKNDNELFEERLNSLVIANENKDKLD